MRIAIADNHPFTLAGIDRVLSAEHDFTVVGTAKNGSEALRLLAQEHVDILVSDLCNPTQEAFSLVREVRRRKWPTRIIILTSSCSRHLLPLLIDVGANDFVLKEDCVDCLVQTLRAVARWDKNIKHATKAAQCSTGPEGSSDAPILGRLTEREGQILSLIASGGSNQTIGRLLQINYKTVDTHRTNLYRKLGVHSVGELISVALRC